MPKQINLSGAQHFESFDYPTDLEQESAFERKRLSDKSIHAAHTLREVLRILNNAKHNPRYVDYLLRHIDFLVNKEVHYFRHPEAVVAGLYAEFEGLINAHDFSRKDFDGNAVAILDHLSMRLDAALHFYDSVPAVQLDAPAEVPVLAEAEVVAEVDAPAEAEAADAGVLAVAVPADAGVLGLAADLSGNEGDVQLDLDEPEDIIYPPCTLV
jgi:hypothetical protein